MPDKDIGLQDTRVHVGDGYQHIPQGGVSDVCNLLLGEQPELGKDGVGWEGNAASINPGSRTP